MHSSYHMKFKYGVFCFVLFATFANKDLQLKYTSLHVLGGRQSTVTVVCVVNNEILASCSAMPYTCWS